MTDIALDEKALGAAIAEPDDTQWHIDRMDSIVRDLWAANDIDLHMCNNTVKRNQSGLLHDIRNSWRVVRHALATASPSQVAPANPAQVTEAESEPWPSQDIPRVNGRDIYEVANQLEGFVDEGTPENLAQFLLREGKAAADLADEIVRLTAAIGAGGPAVARENVAYFTDDKWGGYWQTVRDGKPYNFRLQPHPADERVVEALRECADKLNIARIDSKDEAFRKAAQYALDMADAALSATEGRKDG